ncbi:MAG: hypothetical protein JO022_08895 [Acidobacteriaceae bacterium]|nr:hypothetical protein [Acidobacteriaceae bacterium]
MDESALHPLPNRRGTSRDKELHPAWREFIRYCGDLRHGEVEKLTIQDGVPVLAEITRKKVKFTRER